MTPAEAEATYHSVMDLLESKQGRALLAQGPDAAPLQELHAAAEAGYAPAQYAWADLLDVMGQGSLERLPWLLRAAQQGHEDARNALHALYATDAVLRARVRDQLTTEEVETLGLHKKYSAPPPASEMEQPIHPLFALLALGGLLAMAIAIACSCLSPLAELLDGAEWTPEAWGALIFHLFGFFFLLTFLIALPLEMRQRGSAQWNPLVGGSLILSFCCASVSFLWLGGEGLVLALRGDCPGMGMRGRWWLPGTIMCAIGVFFAFLVLKLVSNYLRYRAELR